MSDADICVLGTAKVVKGVTLWQGVIPVGNEIDDVESFGEAPVFQALGVSALPYPKDENGYAEAMAFRNVGGRSIVYGGARDTRSAAIVGKMEAGDTVVHSTDPSQSSQLQLKGKKRQAALTTKSSKGKTMMLILDGKNDKGQWTCNGAMIEIDPVGDISIVGKGGAGLLFQGNNVFVLGNLKLPGMVPGQVLLQGLPKPEGPGVLVGTITPVLGVGR